MGPIQISLTHLGSIVEEFTDLLSEPITGGPDLDLADHCPFQKARCPCQHQTGDEIGPLQRDPKRNMTAERVADKHGRFRATGQVPDGHVRHGVDRAIVATQAKQRDLQHLARGTVPDRLDDILPVIVEADQPMKEDDAPAGAGGLHLGLDRRALGPAEDVATDLEVGQG
jgi:hypothetical protein